MIRVFDHIYDRCYMGPVPSLSQCAEGLANDIGGGIIQQLGDDVQVFGVSAVGECNREPVAYRYVVAGGETCIYIELIDIDL